MRLWELETKVDAEQGKESKIYQGVLLILVSYLNDLLGGKGSQSSNSWDCPKSNGPDLFRVYLNHINEQDAIVISNAISWAKHQN